jgi:hypothetical protein
VVAVASSMQPHSAWRCATKRIKSCQVFRVETNRDDLQFELTHRPWNWPESPFSLGAYLCCCHVLNNSINVDSIEAQASTRHRAGKAIRMARVEDSGHLGLITGYLESQTRDISGYTLMLTLMPLMIQTSGGSVSLPIFPRRSEKLAGRLAREHP